MVAEKWILIGGMVATIVAPLVCVDFNDGIAPLNLRPTSCLTLHY